MLHSSFISRNSDWKFNVHNRDSIHVLRPYEEKEGNTTFLEQISKFNVQMRDWISKFWIMKKKKKRYFFQNYDRKIMFRGGLNTKILIHWRQKRSFQKCFTSKFTWKMARIMVKGDSATKHHQKTTILWKNKKLCNYAFFQ